MADTQPEPTHVEGEPSAHDILIEWVLKRKQIGLDEYGTILQAGNGRKAEQDVLEELIDGAVYQIVAMRERELLQEKLKTWQIKLMEVYFEEFDGVSDEMPLDRFDTGIDLYNWFMEQGISNPHEYYKELKGE